MIEENPIYIKVSDVPRYLGVSKRHVYEMIEEGKLQIVQVGLKKRPYYRVSMQSIEKYIKSNVL